jgi:hypothetical protein
MRLKLLQAGFENYTGQMGVTFFQNGLSVNEVSEQDARRMAAVLKCETVDGESMNVAQKLLDSMHTEAVVKNVDYASDEPKAEVVPETPAEVAPQAKHTAESLAAIADEKGIAGIREIAEQFSLKGNSIAGLIEAILKAQGE